MLLKANQNPILTELRKERQTKVSGKTETSKLEKSLYYCPSKALCGAYRWCGVMKLHAVVDHIDIIFIISTVEIYARRDQIKERGQF